MPADKWLIRSHSTAAQGYRTFPGEARVEIYVLVLTKFPVSWAKNSLNLIQVCSDLLKQCCTWHKQDKNTDLI